MWFAIFPLVLYLFEVIQGQKIVISNDDGWAVAVIRAQFNAFVDADYDGVVLSCPTINLSGTGKLSSPPTTVIIPCQFDTCPIFSPAEGFNTSDPRLNYVNGFPVDAVEYGIDTLAPELLGSSPDFVVSGPNIGNNLAILLGSGTVGAASIAALRGIPSAVFSGSSDSLSRVSYTTLDSDPTSTNTIASGIYAALTVEFVNALLLSSSVCDPILPPGISLNVNYPSITGCTSVSDYKFVLTRLVYNPLATDVDICGTTHLPTESEVIALDGCFSSVSVFNADTLLDVDAVTQAAVLEKLGSFLTCVTAL